MTGAAGQADMVVAGSGLAACLLVWRFTQVHPDRTVVMLEREPEIAGDQIWSFHEPDLAREATRWIDPLVEDRWSSQRVEFPEHTRRLRAGYRSIPSTRLRERILALGNRVRVETSAQVSTLAPDHALLADGRRFDAPLVIDARGFSPSPHLVLGYQKFVGIEIECDRPHGEHEPVIMDATVGQDPATDDPYRFVYTLPGSPTRIFIEDTHYSDTPTLHEQDYARAARAYAEAKGWRGREVRIESGVLPIALASDAKAFWANMNGNAVPIGMRAHLFQHITGYSLPMAVAVAELVSAAPEATTAAVWERVRDYALALDRRQRFFRLLNRMMFRGCAPDRRYTLLQRFYRMPEPLIERFYAARLTRRDALRIVTGKPPIPLRTALGCLSENKLLREQR